MVNQIRRHGGLKLSVAILAGLIALFQIGAIPKVAAATVRPAVNRPVVHVILAIGQSNMVGRSYGYSAELDPSDPRILEYTASDVLKVAVEPFEHPDPVHLGGPLLATAREFLKSLPVNDIILIVPAAYGGTGFTTPSSTGSQLSWNVDLPAGPNNLYTRSLVQLTKAVASVQALGTVKIDGVLFWDGEQDATHHITGPAWQVYLDKLIAAYRQKLGLPRLAFVLAPSRPDAVAANKWYQNINLVQSSTPSRVPYTAYIPAPIGTQYYRSVDTLHFNMVGYRIIGASYANGLLGILQGLPPLTAPTGIGLAQPADTNSIDITWSAVPRATGYKVEYEASTSTEWSLFGTTGAAEAAITGLAVSTLYHFRVASTDGSNRIGPTSTVFTSSTTD